ncbi:hypothetical protein P5673_030768 [Acropora cervicornis]|uniref:Uncharacterized protein n=1 Tax=Acropora cervicornis TaxID=6130 RepID=A0AAD9PU16_ACRCE|nr:hypothetical protein P5673_030768 [Acropora cervicornis]
MAERLIEAGESSNDEMSTNKIVGDKVKTDYLDRTEKFTVYQMKCFADKKTPTEHETLEAMTFVTSSLCDYNSWSLNNMKQNGCARSKLTIPSLKRDADYPYNLCDHRILRKSDSHVVNNETYRHDLCPLGCKAKHLLSACRKYQGSIRFVPVNHNFNPQVIPYANPYKKPVTTAFREQVTFRGLVTEDQGQYS